LSTGAVAHVDDRAGFTVAASQVVAATVDIGRGHDADRTGTVGVVDVEQRPRENAGVAAVGVAGVGPLGRRRVVRGDHRGEDGG